MTVDGYFVGLMSGTSLDGIDAVVLRVDKQHYEIISSQTYAWPETLKNDLRELIENSDSLDTSLRLDQLCAEQYARASLEIIHKAGLKAADIKAIGSHGQTVRHSPNTTPAYTLQIGNPNRIAEITGVTTVADFRSRDIAAGGQGAPLAPAFHQAVFTGPDKTRVILNIGGIANITLLGEAPVIGYDTGPGNRLMDDWMLNSSGDSFDQDGAFAASGKINPQLLKQMLEDDFFQAGFPKSTGSDYFNLDWLKKQLSDFPAETDENIQATLAALTVSSIVDQIKSVASDCDDVLVCGGGAHNTHLMQQLQLQLGKTPVKTTAEYGIHPDWVEAAAFAWLASQALNSSPGNLPSVTGARGPRICGVIYPGQ